MNALLTVLAMWLLPSALIVAWIWADELLAARADRKHRAEQDREVSPDWIADLATDTPIFADVWAESLRRDLEEC